MHAADVEILYQVLHVLKLYTLSPEFFHKEPGYDREMKPQLAYFRFPGYVGGLGTIEAQVKKEPSRKITCCTETQ